MNLVVLLAYFQLPTLQKNFLVVIPIEATMLQPFQQLSNSFVVFLLER